MIVLKLVYCLGMLLVQFHPFVFRLVVVQLSFFIYI